MYERSAIVLEKYFEQILGFNRENSIKESYENYKQIIEEVKEYQKIVEEEEKVIGKFDEVAKEIEIIQKRQAELHEINMNAENERNQLFNDLGENTSFLDKKLQKIEETLDANNEEIKYLRERYVKALIIFTERQKERNKYARTHRTAETAHIANVEKANKIFMEISSKDVQELKKFMNNEQESISQEIIDIMIKNGKNEKVPFNYQVIKNAVEIRMSIAKRETEIYINMYEKMKKLLAELNGETVKLGKSEKLLRDSGVKLSFLNAEKEYIVDFLDNERMSAMNGKKVHEKLMEDACKNFVSDIAQIDNLYELIIKETTGKSTKKAYKELYNKTYLKNIEDKEKDFEEEVTNIKINMGTVINSNYWRIEGIKNIYNVFNEQIEENFGKDLSEYQIEEKIENTIIKESEEEAEVKLKKRPGRKAKKKEEDRNEEKIEDIENIENTDIDFNIDFEENEDDFDIDNIEENDDFDMNDEEYEEEYEEDEEFDFEDDNEEYENDEYNEENEYEDDDFDFEFDEEDDELTENRVDEIIKNSRKKAIKDDNEKGLFGRLFKK